MYSSIEMFTSSQYFDFSPLSHRHKSQQSVQPVEEVPRRCRLSQHPLHLREGRSCGHSVHHAHCVRAFLVALTSSDEDLGAKEQFFP